MFKFFRQQIKKAISTRALIIHTSITLLLILVTVFSTYNLKIIYSLLLSISFVYPILTFTIYMIKIALIEIVKSYKMFRLKVRLIDGISTFIPVIGAIFGVLFMLCLFNSFQIELLAIIASILLTVGSGLFALVIIHYNEQKVIRKTLSGRIKALMNAKCLTPSKLASISGVKESTVKNWINGNTTPNKDYMIKLVEFFEVSIEYIEYGDS